MNKSGLGLLIGIIGLCVGGYFLLKKYQESESESKIVEDICEEEERTEESPKEMPLRGSESDSKTSLEEPLNLDSYKDFLNRKTAYVASNASEEIKNIFDENGKVKSRFEIVDDSFLENSDNFDYETEVILYYAKDDEIVLKNEDLEELDSSEYSGLISWLSRPAFNKVLKDDWFEAYIYDNKLKTTYFVHRMEG